jgi:catalase (peroxidase I)
MGPRARYAGSDVPDEMLLMWQDPVPEADHELIDDGDVAELKQRILSSEFTVSELVRTAWASARPTAIATCAVGPTVRGSAWSRRRLGSQRSEGDRPRHQAPRAYPEGLQQGAAR